MANPTNVDSHFDDKANVDEVISNLNNIFPSILVNDLRARVNSSDDINHLVEQLIQENSSTNNESSNLHNTALNIQDLIDVFPEEDADFLERILKAYDGNVIQACNYLFNNPAESASVKEDNVSEIQDLTGVQATEVEAYLQKNSEDPVRALLDIVFSSFGDAKCKDKHFKRRVQGTASQGTKEADLPYIYDEGSREALELKSLCLANPEMNKMNYELFERGLVLCKGNVDKVIQIATYILDHTGIDITHEYGTPVKKTDSLSTILQKASRKRQNKVSLTPKINIALPKKTDSKLRLSHSALHLSKFSADEQSLMDQRWLLLEQSGSLDLHMLSLAAATELAKEAAFDWWKLELDARQADGNFLKFGSLAIFIQPLRIITGRGLHSANGVSKIKNSVKRVLSSQLFIFEELPGSLQVIGKRLR
ncbi:uncharacterized protein PRCAT00003558001 [Priceomyces carsonii]|uniref:uncharacterized protein n=1 Tax=Priceomyces carsonii TaxID=28549 RepID=UPI002ED90FA6|nr:unnamed protein product [Priceomyces carsonii]